MDPSSSAILAAVDLTHEPDLVLAAAAQQARMREGADVHLVHVATRPAGKVLTNQEVLEEAQKLFDLRTEQLRKDFGGRVFVHVILGDPWRDIVDLASELGVDLVLIGTHGRKGVARALLGSVAELVVRHAPCAVLVVRSPQPPAEGERIEPPCADCLVAQKESSGKMLWCERHAQTHPRPHLHYEMPRGYGAGAMFLRR